MADSQLIMNQMHRSLLMNFENQKHTPISATFTNHCNQLDEKWRKKIEC